MSPTPAKNAEPTPSMHEPSSAVMSRHTILLIIIGLLIFVGAIYALCSINARRGIKQVRYPNTGNNHRSTCQARRRPTTRIDCSVASHTQHTCISPDSNTTLSSATWSHNNAHFRRTNSTEPLLLHNAAPQLSLWDKFFRFLQVEGGTRRRSRRSTHHTLRPVDTSSVYTRRVDTDTTIGGESVILPPPTYDGFSPVRSRSYYADIGGINTTYSVRHEQELGSWNEPTELPISPDGSPANTTTTTTNTDSSGQRHL